MYKKIKHSEGVEVMFNTLKKEGVFVIENFLQGNDVELLLVEMKNYLSNSKMPYTFGKLYRGKSLEKYNKESQLRKIFDVDWMKSLSKKYHPNKPYGQSVVSTHDYIETDNWERQGWLHFDKSNSLKFFLYLTDVDEGCGAFEIVPKSHKMGKKLRTEWGSNQYEKKRKLEDTLKDYLLENKILPIMEKRGSLIVFDSDTFHKGGAVKNGKERIIVRLHNK